MNYEKWFDKKLNPATIINGNLSIREFGAIVHRATLRGDIREETLTKSQRKLLQEITGRTFDSLTGCQKKFIRGQAKK